MHMRHALAFLLIASSAVTARAEVSAPRVAAPAGTGSGAVSDPFEKGSRYWSVRAATSRKPSLAWFTLTQISASYYLADDLAIEYGGQFGYVESYRTSGGAYGGPELGFRWHFNKNQQWSVYLEALAGAVYQQHSITPASLRFNFDLQGGGGATYRISNDTLLGGGIRAHHLSNARVRGRNRNMGYDGTMLYIELMKSF